MDSLFLSDAYERHEIRFLRAFIRKHVIYEEGQTSLMDTNVLTASMAAQKTTSYAHKKIFHPGKPNTAAETDVNRSAASMRIRGCVSRCCRTSRKRKNQLKRRKKARNAEKRA